MFLKIKFITILNIVLILGFLSIISYYTFSAPRDTFWQEEMVINISSKDNLTTVAKKLKENKIIKNEKVFRTLVFVLGGDKNVQKGDYAFKRNSNLIKVVLQIVKSNHNIQPIKITFREGLTKEEMAEILSQKMKSFRKDIFLSQGEEGYLFPDTYFFYPFTETEEILDMMNNNFKNRMKDINKEIEKSGKLEKDIIIMASLIEKEAKGSIDAEIISGILWKRLEIGMPLQADASPITYKEKGLPKDSICNPGLSSIKASLFPKESSYLFYLHDKNGNVYFARNFEEHKKNIQDYLK